MPNIFICNGLFISLFPFLMWTFFRVIRHSTFLFLASMPIPFYYLLIILCLIFCFALTFIWSLYVPLILTLFGFVSDFYHIDFNFKSQHGLYLAATLLLAFLHFIIIFQQYFLHCIFFWVDLFMSSKCQVEFYYQV